MALTRLDRWLSSKGYCTRRQAEQWARQGRIVYRGQPLFSASEKVSGEGLEIDDQPADPEQLYILLNKPSGYTCSHRDVGPLVYSLFPERWNERRPLLSGVGRLDRDTTGVILFSDDGDLIHRLTSPRSHIEKVYEVFLESPVKDEDIAAIEAGSICPPEESKPFRPGKVEVLQANHLLLTLVEGRYHEVKRMFAFLENQVIKLHRRTFAGLGAGDLAEGQWRLLTAQELQHLQQLLTQSGESGAAK